MTVAIEEKLRDLGLKVEAEPFALTPLGRGGRRRLFVRRMALGGLAAAVLLGVIGGVVLGAGIRREERETTIAPSLRLESYRDPGYGWEMSYPSNWHLQRIVNDCGGKSFCVRGALVSNFDRDFQHPRLCDGCSTSAWDMADVPSDFVGVQFAWGCCEIGMPRSDHPDTKFPLLLESLSPADDDPTTKEPPRNWRSVWVDGWNRFTVFVWIGPNASQESIQAADAIVASLTKPVHADEHPLGVGEAWTPVGDEQASIRIGIEPAIVSKGDAPVLLVENTGPIDLGYAPEFRLEIKRASGGWRPMNQEQGFTRPLFGLTPGQKENAGSLEVFAGEDPVVLAEGTYRVTKVFNVEGSDHQLTVSALFMVVNDPSKETAATGRIAFVLGRPLSAGFQLSPSELPAIYTMAADGSDVRKIIPNAEAQSLSPTSWSPDGTRLMYLRGASVLTR